MFRVRLTDGRGRAFDSAWDHDGNTPYDTLLVSLGGWVGGVGVRREEMDRTSHGSFPPPTRLTGRTLTLRVLFEHYDRKELWKKERFFSGLFNDGEPGKIEVWQDDDLLWCGVGRDGEPKITTNVDGGYVEAEFPLSSPDPWLYGPKQSVSVSPAGSGVGLIYPLYAPSGTISYGKSSTSTSGVLTNPGNADAWPIYWVSGDLPSGFRIYQDNHVLEWNGSLPKGVPLAVDTIKSSLQVNGVNQSQRLSRDEFFPVPPDGSIKVEFEPLGGGTGTLLATLSPTYT